MWLWGFFLLLLLKEEKLLVYYYDLFIKRFFLTRTRANKRNGSVSYSRIIPAWPSGTMRGCNVAGSINDEVLLTLNNNHRGLGTNKILKACPLYYSSCSTGRHRILIMTNDTYRCVQNFTVGGKDDG